MARETVSVKVAADTWPNKTKLNKKANINEFPDFFFTLVAHLEK